VIGVITAQGKLRQSPHCQMIFHRVQRKYMKAKGGLTGVIGLEKHSFLSWPLPFINFACGKFPPTWHLLAETHARTRITLTKQYFYSIQKTIIFKNEY
jgi:hypothetical protein